MPAHTPEEVQRLFADAFGSHDLESVLALYEPDATLIPQPGEVVTGLRPSAKPSAKFSPRSRGLISSLRSPSKRATSRCCFPIGLYRPPTLTVTPSRWVAGPQASHVASPMGAGSSRSTIPTAPSTTSANALAFKFSA